MFDLVGKLLLKGSDGLLEAYHRWSKLDPYVQYLLLLLMFGLVSGGWQILTQRLNKGSYKQGFEDGKKAHRLDAEREFERFLHKHDDTKTVDGERVDDKPENAPPRKKHPEEE